ncbi:MAG: hypothetical protein GXY75_05755 [Bacteroidales bacterium]|nr:hypothetical protein [Bacteroidales bacterium]
MKSKFNKEQILQEYYDTYHKDTAKARKLIKKLDYKNDPYLLSEIATSYFDENKLRLAERYAIKAFELDYLNPATLWILALVKWDYGQIDSAIFAFQEIIRIGTRRIHKIGYRENKDVALARINDSKFQLYRLLKEKKPAVAKRYLREYEKGIEKGLDTIVDCYYQQVKAKE